MSAVVEPFPHQQRSTVFLRDRPPCHPLAEGADGSRKEPA
jgi:hypothetical protein